MIKDHRTNPLWCPTCNTRLLNIHDQYGIASCKCAKYPILCGIVIFKKTQHIKNVCRLLQQGKRVRATLSMIDENKIVKILLGLILLLRSKSITLFTTVSYNRALSLIWFVSTNKSWWNYLRRRERMPSHYLSLLTRSFIHNSSSTYVDVGCGTGALLQWITNNTFLTFPIGIDTSFFSLLLARLFVVSPKTILINADVGHIPLGANHADIITINDSWQCFPKTTSVINTFRRISSRNATLLIFHIFNPHESYRLQPIYFPTTPSAAIASLTNAGFSHFSILPDQKIITSLQNGQEINLASEPEGIMNNALSYSLFSSKKLLPKKLKPNRDIQYMIRRRGIDFYQDKELQATISLEMMANYDKYIFISPHLDDAVLSSGALIQLLKTLGKKVTIITLFTRATPKPYSQMATEYLKKCEIADADTLFTMRKKEDALLCNRLGIQHIHMEYIDAAWRKNSDGEFVYLTPEKQFSGVIAPSEQPLIKNIQASLHNIIKPTQGRTLLLTSLGVGGHADHHITKRAVSALPYPTLFWEDFPYNAIQDNAQVLKGDNYSFAFQIKTSIKEKQRYIRMYTSQMSALFPKNIIPEIPENYYERALKAL